MRKHTWIALVAAAALLVASAGTAQDGMSAGPIARGSQNVLGKFSCDVYQGGYGLRDFTVEIVRTPKGGGSPTIVATQPGTDVFVNGSATPFNATPLAPGEYIYVTGQFSSGDNMLIESNEPVLAFQMIGGSSDEATPGFNFIPYFLLDPNNSNRMIACGRALWRTDTDPASGASLACIAI